MSEEVITSIYKTVYTDTVSVVLHLLQVQVANVSSLNFELFLKRYICIHNIHIQLNASMCVLNNGPVDDNDSLFFFFFSFFHTQVIIALESEEVSYLLL